LSTIVNERFTFAVKAMGMHRHGHTRRRRLSTRHSRGADRGKSSISEDARMKVELITRREDLVIRRLVLEPGEAMFWHKDNCHRFTVVVRGSRLAIEFRDSSKIVEVVVSPGAADWDTPEERVHRAINTGTETYEEVVTFYRTSSEVDPQPIAEDTKKM